jgi:hypothetical protein
MDSARVAAARDEGRGCFVRRLPVPSILLICVRQMGLAGKNWQGKSRGAGAQDDVRNCYGIV